MATCDPFQFSGITAAIFERIAAELTTKGFALNGPSGRVHGPFGIVIDYVWDEAAGSLRIDVVEKSFFVSCDQIKSQLTTAFEKYTQV